MARSDAIEAHYSLTAATQLASAILARFEGDRPVSVAELSAIDQLHSRGVVATRELARLAGIAPGETLLDVGSGIGGPARQLAAEFGARVTGIDLTPSFCEVARILSNRTDLGDRVRFLRASALALPLADNSVDIAWAQHVAMNIADKPALYDELNRVLRRHGRLALHEIFTGEVSPPHYPVPWARTAGNSFLEAPETLRQRLSARFELVTWRDATAATIAWAKETQARRLALPTGAPPPIPALIFGDDFGRMADILLRNLEERRVCVIEAVFRKR
jgi:SAM-dependent methyltransferase